MLQIQLTEAHLVYKIGWITGCVLSEYLSFYLGVEEDIRDEVSLNCHRVAKNCFTEVVGRWLSHEDGTGDNPHTWETVFTEKFLSLLKGICQGILANIMVRFNVHAEAYAPKRYTHIHTYIHIHTYTHTYIYTYIHTYICMHTNMCCIQ